MRKSILYGCAIMALVSVSGASSVALAGPWEDGMAAYNRGDYVPAIRLFRPLAEKGNPKAQSVIGVMYRKGEGVAKSSRAPSCGSAWRRNGATPRPKRDCRKCRGIW